MPIFALDMFELWLRRSVASRGEILPQFSAGTRCRKKFCLRAWYWYHHYPVIKFHQRIGCRGFKQIVQRPMDWPTSGWRQEAPEEVPRRLQWGSPLWRSRGVTNRPELSFNSLNLLAHVRHHTIYGFNRFHCIPHASA